MCPTSLLANKSDSGPLRPSVYPASHIASAISPASDHPSSGRTKNGNVNVNVNKPVAGGQEQQQQYKRESQDVNREGSVTVIETESESESEEDEDKNKNKKIESMMMPMHSNSHGTAGAARPSMKLDFRLFFGSLFDDAQRRQNESAGRFNLLMNFPPQRASAARTSDRYNGPRSTRTFVDAASYTSSDESASDAFTAGNTTSDDSATDTDVGMDMDMDMDEPLVSSEDERRRDVAWADRALGRSDKMWDVRVHEMYTSASESSATSASDDEHGSEGN